MDIYDTIESILDSNDGQINGRTAIQKLVYLSHHSIPELDIPQYKPHYYGPYSSDLSLSLEKLVSYSFVSEIKIPGTMFEGYRYQLTDDGKKVVSGLKTEQKIQYDKINKVVKICKEFCDLKISSLSYASKIFFMLSHQPKDKRKMTRDNAMHNAKDLGWKISEEDVNKGVSLLEKLNLVQIIK